MSIQLSSFFMSVSSSIIQLGNLVYEPPRNRPTFCGKLEFQTAPRQSFMFLSSVAYFFTNSTLIMITTSKIIFNNICMFRSSSLLVRKILITNEEERSRSKERKRKGFKRERDSVVEEESPASYHENSVKQTASVKQRKVDFCQTNSSIRFRRALSQHSIRHALRSSLRSFPASILPSHLAGQISPVKRA